ncbi:large-conductance mechanosensitive channel [Coprinopsis sp. MPI-PUGE-AT-0042]|nr:large-conductance mechanosensitive channel [Coprinopsis sp. MPI-PUGE-AT-0042]
MAEHSETLRSRWGNDARTALLDTERQVSRRFQSLWTGFTAFALRDNVLEVAVGLILATAFTKVTNSLVSDVILPPVSLLPFMSKNLEEKFLVLKRGPNYEGPNGYNTREQAAQDGAIVWAYGAFGDEVVKFIGVGISLYVIASLYGALSKESIIRHTMHCQYCRKEISAKVSIKL